jgi:antitoxin component of RelBE/YafQ-DinJ toxin-antitoxin module
VVAPAKPGPSDSEAIRLFYKRMALRNGLPRDVTIPNGMTRRATREVERGGELTRSRDTDERIEKPGP